MKLRQAFDREMDGLCRDVKAFPWENRDAYGRWLVNTWGYVRHTTRLTALAAARLPFGIESLHVRLVKHAAEEAGHENLLVADLQALGIPFVASEVLPITTALAQCLYYQIEYLSPFAIFGRILPLEGVSAQESAPARARVIEAHGDGGTTFLKVHGDADPTHVEEAFAALANVGPNEVDIIADAMHLTTSLYRGMLAAIASSVR